MFQGQRPSEISFAEGAHPHGWGVQSCYRFEQRRERPSLDKSEFLDSGVSYFLYFGEKKKVLPKVLLQEVRLKTNQTVSQWGRLCFYGCDGESLRLSVSPQDSLFTSRPLGWIGAALNKQWLTAQRETCPCAPEPNCPAHLTRHLPLSSAETRTTFSPPSRQCVWLGPRSSLSDLCCLGERERKTKEKT